MLRAIDQRLQLTERITEQMLDDRDPTKVKHPVVDLLRQRVYGLACGYEDLNDMTHSGTTLRFKLREKEVKCWAVVQPYAD